MAENPIDELLKGLVVFRNGEDGEYVSNNPLWNDGRIRKAWLRKFGPAAEEREIQHIEDPEEVPAYETWTNQDLRNELVSRSLSVEGNKAEMVKRLQEDDAKEA
jgi:hypothetical protein